LDDDRHQGYKRHFSDSLARAGSGIGETNLGETTLGGEQGRVESEEPQTYHYQNFAFFGLGISKK